MFSILEVAECGDYTVAYVLSVVQRVLGLFQIIIPILLIVGLIFSFIRLFTSPDNSQKIMKGIVGKIIGLILCFLTPWIVGVVLDMVTLVNPEDGAKYTLGKCWRNAEEIRSEIDETDDKNVGNKLNKKPISPSANIPGGSSNSSGQSGQSSQSSQSGNKDSVDSKLKRVIIGDSRTEGMCIDYRLCGSDAVVAESGKALSWFKLTGQSKANSYLQGEKKAVFVLLGVNDVGDNASTGQSRADSYYSHFYSLAKGSWKKHAIYFVSINGVIDGRSNATNSAINAFNSRMKQKIQSSSASNFYYCDTASKIQVNSTTSPDGLHYTSSTYKKIYNAMLKCMGA